MKPPCHFMTHKFNVSGQKLYFRNSNLCLDYVSLTFLLKSVLNVKCFILFFVLQYNQMFYCYEIVVEFYREMMLLWNCPVLTGNY